MQVLEYYLFSLLQKSYNEGRLTPYTKHVNIELK